MQTGEATEGGLTPSELHWARQHGLAEPEDSASLRAPPMRADNAADFDAIEAEIARRLCATPDRCAFLRSSTYLHFRMSALYSARGAPTGIFTPCGVHVAYTPDERGGTVTVRVPHDPLAARAPADAEECSSEVQSSYRVVVPVRRPGRPRKCGL
jgi:hypothetical protein